MGMRVQPSHSHIFIQLIPPLGVVIFPLGYDFFFGRMSSMKFFAERLISDVSISESDL